MATVPTTAGYRATREAALATKNSGELPMKYWPNP